MNERYTRLLSLPQNYYCESAPLIIAAGALLMDNYDGDVLVQLKLQSITNNAIKAVSVSVTPFDIAGRTIGGKITHQYLDLNILRDEYFGQKSPILMSDPSTRGFSVSVDEVVFADNTIWTCGGKAWETLAEQQYISVALGDLELIKQFRLEYGSSANRIFVEQKGLWYCTCGAVNNLLEDSCHKCHSKLSDLQSFNLNSLRNDKDERLAKEAALNEERLAKVAAMNEELRQKKAAQKEAAKAKKKEYGKYGIIFCIITAIILITVLLITKVFIPAAEEREKEAQAIAEQREQEAQLIAAYDEAEALLESGETAKAAISFGELGDYSDARERSFAIWNNIAQRETFLTGDYFSVALRTDGTVVATGYNDDGRCDVGDWSDIIAISSGVRHTVGLKDDGTVVATGYNDDGRCDVEDWSNIVAVFCGNTYTVGLKTDGTVVAAGRNDDGRCDVGDWSDIVTISCDWEHTVGLKSDGTVVATGYNGHGECNVEDWSNIVAVSCGESHTIGLKSDGTVVAAGRNDDGECDVDAWSDIIAVSCSESHTIGLKSDGTVVATGYNNYGQCNVDRWIDIKVPTRIK